MTNDRSTSARCRLFTLATALALVASLGCPRPNDDGGQRTFAGQPDPTPPYTGSLTDDSAFYAYARSLAYNDASNGRDTADLSNGIGVEVRNQLGSALIPAASLGDGSARGIGRVLVNGPLPSEYSYLPNGLSYVMVRATGGGVFETRFLTPTGPLSKNMTVSVPNLPSGTPSDARVLRISARLYLCYTCDRKLCCPENGVATPAQQQTDVNAAAVAW